MRFRRRFYNPVFDAPAADGASAVLGRYIGYDEPYAANHEALDHDQAVMEETRNAAASLAQQVKAIRRGRAVPDAGVREPRPK